MPMKRDASTRRARAAGRDTTTRPGFRPGRNIAMKLPLPQYEATVAFYRDVLGLEPLDTHPPAVGFRFGDKNLWLDRCPGMGQTEVWLEIVCDDLQAAAAHLQAHGVARCDAIEPLGALPGFWISSPASVVHLVCKDEASWS